MPDESKIALNCPCCGEPIYETLNWFKQSASICPACDKGLTADQFTAVIDDLEQAIDTSIEERICEPPHTSCCGKNSSCCKNH